jgi:uncharacterized protein (UPF0276 family)
MKFAVNYSPPAAKLLGTGRVEFDYFKCPPWRDLIEAARDLRPVYVHFWLAVGKGTGHAIDSEKGQPVDWAEIEEWMALTGTSFVNLHLMPGDQDYQGIPVDTTDPAHIELLTENMIRDVSGVVERFGASRVIVENANSGGGRHLRPALLPEVITRVVRATGCGFLLDISHARMAARDLGMSAEQYIQALPVQRTREIHITGLQYLAGDWLNMAKQSSVDPDFIARFHGRLLDHLPMTQEDWEFFAWSIQQIRKGLWGQPWMVAFEYGGVGKFFGAVTMDDILLDQIPRLYEMIFNCNMPQEVGL